MRKLNPAAIVIKVIVFAIAFIAVMGLVYGLSAAMPVTHSVSDYGEELITKDGAAVVDLSRALNRSSRSLYKLDGEWEFYPGALYSYEDFAEGNITGGRLVAWPHLWNEEENFDPRGYGTYRLQVILPDDFSTVGIYSRAQYSAYEIFVGDERACAAGTVSANRDEHRMAQHPVVGYAGNVGADGEPVTLIIHVQNYSHYYAGLAQSVFISDANTVKAFMGTLRVFDGIVIGLVMFMFLYFLLVYLNNTKRTEYLDYAGIAGMLMFLMVTYSGMALLYSVSQYLPLINGDTLLTLEYFATFFGAFLSSRQIILSYAKEHFPRFGIKPVYIAVAAFSLFLLITPVYYITMLRTPITLVIALSFLLPRVIELAFDAQSRHSVLSWISSLFVVMAIVFRIFPLNPWESIDLFAIFLIIHCILQMQIFLSHYSDIERELLSNYGQLEIMVTERTKQLDGQRIVAEQARSEAERERQLAQQANEAKSNFLAKMSHEIRTPMNAIIGMSELILREEASPAIREHASGVKQAGANLLAIVNDILDFSKVESGKLELVEAEYELASLLNDVVSIIRMRVMEKPVLFAVNIDAALPRKLYGDEVRVRQVLLNLLSNAVNYTRSGHILFSANGVRDGGSDNVLMYFGVEDTGVGIRPEDMGNLFRSFEQFDTHVNRGVTGTGLGLSITRSFARLMGGDVVVESVYGEGSVFTASILQRVADGAPIAKVQSPEDKNVLIFDNREVIVKSFIAAAESLRVTHKFATNLQSFVAAMNESGYQYIFVAAHLLESARKVIKNSGRTGARLIALSNYTDPPPAGVRTVSMPINVMHIANILDDEADSVIVHDHNFDGGVNFSAPNARILIVDDIRTNLRVAEGLLAPLGAKIDTCLSGRESIDLIKQNHYDLVFMDHMMPDMDGVETTEAIRALQGDYYKNVPVIALTANAISGMRDMFIQRGFSDYIAKPIETAKLFDVVSRLLPAEKREAPVRKLVQSIPEEEITLAIQNVDVRKGIAQSGGSLAEYMEVLRLFCTDAAERTDMIRDFNARHDIKSLTVQAHALKGAAATIGAADVSQMALQLEQAGKDNNTGFIEETCGIFCDKLLTLTWDIKQGLSANAGGTDDSGADSSQTIQTIDPALLKKLRTALENEDVTEADLLLTEIGASGEFGVTITNILSDISNGVLMYDFDSAMKALKEIDN